MDRGSRRPWILAVGAAALALAVLLLVAHPPWGASDTGARPDRSASPDALCSSAPTLSGVAPGRVAEPSPPSTDAEGPVAHPDDAEMPDPEAPELALRVEAFDVHTGRPVRGVWNPAGEPPTMGPYSPEQCATPEAFAKAQEECRSAALETQQRWEASWVPLGEPAREPLPAFWSICRWLGLRLEPGWVPFDVTLAMGDVAADAREARVRLPVAPEAVLDVIVLAPDGSPAEGVEVDTVRLGASERSVDVEERGPGSLRVRGLPLMPGEPVEVSLVWEPDEPSPGAAESTGEGARTPFVARTDVPASLAAPWQVTARLRGPSPRGEIETEEVVARPALDPDLRAEQAEPGEPAGQVRVLMLTADGEPVAGAEFLGQVTQADGAVLVTGLRPGRRTLWFIAKGHLGAHAEVEVVADAQVALVLREPRGASLDVRVVDGEGRALPGARLTLEKTRWFDVVDGLQRFDWYCDAAGRRTFERVQPGPCRLTAAWLGRRGSAAVDLADGDTARLTIVVR